MKRIIFILSIFMIAISCNSLSTSEKSIQEYMRTQTGSPDLEIEFTNVQITKQTVGDSIDILQKIFEEQIKEKEKTIKRIENDNQAWQKELESMSKKDQNYRYPGKVRDDLAYQSGIKGETNQRGGFSAYSG